MIEITAVRFAGGRDHAHITEVQWRSASTVAAQSTRQGMAEWLGSRAANRAVVSDGTDSVDVAVVAGPDGSLYIRTHAAGVWRNDLLALPTY